jgi:hypothetical protein
MDRLILAGTKHLQVLVIGCQTDIHSSDIGECTGRPIDDQLVVVDRAIAKGINTSIFPLLGTQKAEWRGFFDPTDVAAWFHAYTGWITRMAAESEKRHLSELVVGSEYSALQKHEPEWRQVIAAVRQVFHGPLIFTVNWDAINVGFFDAVDAIGLSAYFPLSTDPNPSQEVLDQAWADQKATLLALSKRWGKPLHITEVGYTNSDSAAATPFHTASTAQRDDALQQRCFEAFRRAWKDESQLVRSSVWASSGFEMESVAISGDPVGHPAEQSLAAYFSERAMISPNGCGGSVLPGAPLSARHVPGYACGRLGTLRDAAARARPASAP